MGSSITSVLCAVARSAATHEIGEYESQMWRSGDGLDVIDIYSGLHSRRAAHEAVLAQILVALERLEAKSLPRSVVTSGRCATSPLIGSASVFIAKTLLGQVRTACFVARSLATLWHGLP